MNAIFINYSTLRDAARVEFETVVNTYSYTDNEKRYFEDVEAVDNYTEYFIKDMNDSFKKLFEPEFKNSRLRVELESYLIAKDPKRYNATAIQKSVDAVKAGALGGVVSSFRNDLTSFIFEYFGTYDMKYNFSNYLDELISNAEAV